MPNSLQPHGLYSPWNSPGQILEWVAFPILGDLPNPGIEPRFHTLQADSLSAEPQGKPLKDLAIKEVKCASCLSRFTV